MFFDAVVGNPPYQIVGSGDNKNFAAPVYHLFMSNAFKLADKVSLVHPARCLFNAGATPQEFRNKILNDPHLKVVRYEPNSKKLFPSSTFEGGVVITLRDANENFGAIETFIAFDELISIQKKVCVDDKNFRPLSEIVFGRTKYFLTKKFIEDHPNAPFLDRKDDFFKSNLFQYAAKYFFNDKPNDGHEYIQVCGLDGNTRATKFIRRDYILISDNNLNFDKFKVFVSEANGASGKLNDKEPARIISKPVVGSPLVGSTQTFITVGAFDTRAEAEACISYIRSKFCRVMLGILKVTQHNPPATWAKVPLQDFTSASDIDWSGNVDEQLYRKYNLNDAEKKFIEEHVRAMT